MRLGLEFQSSIGQDTIARMKERKRRKAMLSDRKSLAAQQRMKNITSLASDQPTGPKKRKRGGDGECFALTFDALCSDGARC